MLYIFAMGNATGNTDVADQYPGMDNATYGNIPIKTNQTNQTNQTNPKNQKMFEVDKKNQNKKEKDVNDQNLNVSQNFTEVKALGFLGTVLACLFFAVMLKKKGIAINNNTPISLTKEIESKHNMPAIMKTLENPNIHSDLKKIDADLKTLYNYFVSFRAETIKHQQNRADLERITRILYQNYGGILDVLSNQILLDNKNIIDLQRDNSIYSITYWADKMADLNRLLSIEKKKKYSSIEQSEVKLMEEQQDLIINVDIYKYSEVMSRVQNFLKHHGYGDKNLLKNLNNLSFHLADWRFSDTMDNSCVHIVFIQEDSQDTTQLQKTIKKQGLKIYANDFSGNDNLVSLRNIAHRRSKSDYPTYYSEYMKIIGKDIALIDSSIFESPSNLVNYLDIDRYQKDAEFIESAKRNLPERKQKRFLEIGNMLFNKQTLEYKINQLEDKMAELKLKNDKETQKIMKNKITPLLEIFKKIKTNFDNQNNFLIKKENLDAWMQEYLQKDSELKSYYNIDSVIFFRDLTQTLLQNAFVLMSEKHFEPYANLISKDLMPIFNGSAKIIQYFYFAHKHYDAIEGFLSIQDNPWDGAITDFIKKKAPSGLQKSIPYALRALLYFYPNSTSLIKDQYKTNLPVEFLCNVSKKIFIKTEPDLKDKIKKGRPLDCWYSNPLVNFATSTAYNIVKENLKMADQMTEEQRKELYMKTTEFTKLIKKSMYEYFLPKDSNMNLEQLNFQKRSDIYFLFKDIFSKIKDSDSEIEKRKEEFLHHSKDINYDCVALEKLFIKLINHAYFNKLKSIKHNPKSIYNLKELLEFDGYRHLYLEQKDFLIVKLLTLLEQMTSGNV